MTFGLFPLKITCCTNLVDICFSFLLEGWVIFFRRITESEGRCMFNFTGNDKLLSKVAAAF